MKTGLVLLAALAAASPSAFAFAQSPARVVPRERTDQAPGGPTGRAQPAPRAPAAAPAQISPFAPFILRQVSVEGSSLAQDKLDAATRPFIGQTIEASTVVRITDAVAAEYAKSSIALYSVLAPNQAFGEGGVLRLAAVEGYVGEVAVQGDIAGRDMNLLRSYLQKLTAEKPLRKHTLQRYVALIRDLPGLNANLNLAQGPQLGQVRLEVAVQPRTVRWGIALNNRGTAFLGRTQAQADVNLYSFFRQGDQTRLSVAVPVEHIERFQYYSAFHSTPVGLEGTTLSVNGGYLRTKPDFFDLNGHAYSLGFQVSHPIYRSIERGLYVTAGLDGVNSSNALFGQTLFNDRVRAARVGAAFNWERPTRYFGANVTLSRGLGGFLGGRTLNADGVDLHFTKLNVRTALNTRLGKPFVLRLNGAAQLTSDRLPGSEQFALGGDEFGRAYEAALVAGDRALAGSAEFALRPPKGLPKGFEGSEAYVFVDGGHIRYRARYGFPPQKVSLGSTGGGVRIAVKQKIELQLEAARTMRNSSAFLDRRETRAIFAVRTVF